MQRFLDACELPALNQIDCSSLDTEITCGEIMKTIRPVKNGKSPGPDRFSNEIYKTFSDLLAAYLHRMHKDGVLPQTRN